MNVITLTDINALIGIAPDSEDALPSKENNSDDDDDSDGEGDGDNETANLRR